MLLKICRLLFHSLPLETFGNHKGQIFHLKVRLIDQLNSRFHSLPENVKSISVALLYGFFSTSMNFLNKLVVSTYEFNFPFFLMLVQMIFSVISIDALKYFDYLTFPSYKWKEGKKLIPASTFFSLHSTLSLSALHGMNIPMYGAIKRCTPLVSLVLSVLILKKAYPSKLIVLAILIITFGCLLAGFGDLQFDQHAYIMGTLSVLAQGSYLTLVQKCAENHKSTLEMMYLNAYNTLPFFIICSIFYDEPRQISQMNGLNDFGFYVSFLFVIIWGNLLTFTQFLCASVCSALTASLVLVGKSVIQTSLGFVTFGGVKYHPLNILGIVLNCLGGFLYTYVKYQEGQEKRKNKEIAKETSRDCDVENKFIEENESKFNPVISKENI